MKITSTNNFPNAHSSFAVSSDANASYDIEDIETGDFSTAYTSAGSASAFTFTKSFSATFACSYVAIAGHNFGDIGGSLAISVNGALKETITFTAGTANNVVLIHFTEVTCSSISVTLTKTTSTDRATITYLSAGELFSDTFQYSSNTEQAGFMRPWVAPSKTIKAIANGSAQPVAYLRESQAPKITLTMDVSRVSTINASEFTDFCDRIYSRGDFFIKEEDGDADGYSTDNPKSSYLCFDADVSVKTHSATRALNALVVKASCYTGR